MSTTTEAPAAADLSSLDKRQRLNIAVARTQGWEVWHYPDDDTAILFPPLWFSQWMPETMVFVEGDGGKEVVTLPRQTPPDYAGDPAAWGALMEREGVWPEPYFDDGVPVLWRGFFVGVKTGETIFTPVSVGQVGSAVSLAVLMKHGIDPTPYIGD